MMAISKQNKARSAAVTSATALSSRACAGSASVSANISVYSDTALAVSFFAFCFYSLFITFTYFLTAKYDKTANAR